MRHFLRLLRKDLEASRLPVGFLSGITLIIMLFVRFKISSGAWAAENFVAAVAIPVAFMPLWLIWQSFQTLRSEWREDTVYTLLVLPVAGWKVMLAKLVSIWVEYSVLCVATVGGTLIFFGTFLEELFRALPSVSWAIWNGFMVYLLGLAILSSVVIFVQLAFVISKMVGRLQGLVALWVWVLASWLVSRLSLVLEPLFRWLPPLPLHKLLRLGELDSDIILELNLAPQIGVLLGTLGLFWLTGYLFEHYVEISG